MMEEEQIKEFKKQHFDNYKNNILDIIDNNTNSFVNEDIKTLISKPPLDSMDVLKNKFLELSKKNEIILDTEELSKLLDNYRNNIIKVTDKIKKERISTLSKKVNSTKDFKVIEFYKKDFNSLDKELKKELKISMNDSYEKVFTKGINKIFSKDIDESIKNKIIDEISKFINKKYQKQVMDSFDIKILVKDTILINAVKEATERYLFTLDNSKLLNLD